MLLESTFIDAMRETPDDAGLRLVYADWLDDAGDSRGELVRLQCELDKTPLNHPQRNMLHQAIRELCLDYQSDWLAPLKRRVLGWQKARFQFGLVENIAMSPAAFLKHAEAGLFEEMPHLVGVCLEGKEQPIEEALASPYMARLKSLKLFVSGSHDTGKPIECLGSLPTVRNLTSLDLSNCHYGDKVIAGLLRSRNLLKLRRLNLQNNFLTPRIAGVLRDSPCLPQLEMLALGTRWPSGRNSLGDVGVREFLTSVPPLPIRWLDLAANDLSDSSAWDLSQSGSLDRIECLFLWGNTFGNAARTALEARFPNRVFHAACEPECLTR